ncbi:MAG: cytochrome b/b6 domain-containing protein [Methyloligellaceae bacterium]
MTLRESTRSAPTIEARPASKGQLVYRQSVWTRVTHWLWAISLFFLMTTGLQIFNAHPTLYVGSQSGFGFDNTVLEIGEVRQDGKVSGYTEIFGNRFDTTGVLGVSGTETRPVLKAFPEWATIPSSRDLGTGRVIHLFFAWIFFFTLVTWLAASLVNGHLRDLIPSIRDLRHLPRDLLNHLRFRIHHTAGYNVLQKLTYAIVLFVLFPLMIATGLTMSPAANAIFPFLTEIFGGRQTARSLHFLFMVLLMGFFIVHIIMIFAAGPINELRSIITGWYKTSPGEGE